MDADQDDRKQEGLDVDQCVVPVDDPEDDGAKDKESDPEASPVHGFENNKMSDADSADSVGEKTPLTQPPKSSSKEVIELEPVVDKNVLTQQELEQKRETLFFRDGKRRIDFMLAYQEKENDEKNEAKKKKVPTATLR